MNDSFNCNEKITKIMSTLLTFSITLLVGTITYIFLNLTDNVEDLSFEIRKLREEVNKLHSVTRLQTLNMQVTEDRTKENEREIRELIKKSYGK